MPRRANVSWWCRRCSSLPRRARPMTTGASTCGGCSATTCLSPANWRRRAAAGSAPCSSRRLSASALIAGRPRCGRPRPGRRSSGPRPNAWKGEAAPVGLFLEGLRPPKPSRGRGNGETWFPHSPLQRTMFIGQTGMATAGPFPDGNVGVKQQGRIPEGSATLPPPGRGPDAPRPPDG